MNRCPACGATYQANAKFCPSDGARLVDAPLRKPEPVTPEEDRATALAKRPRVEEQQTPELAPGERVDGRYLVERKLGEGGMSFVYLVRDIATGERYALKVLSVALSSDHKAMARLRREASFGMRLAHPNICHILRLGETASRLVYVVMPYIDGEVLSDRVYHRGQLPLDEVRRHVTDVAAGLHAAHRLRIVHRDLKPENVMVCQRADGSEYAVVMDFGLAKERRAEAELQKLTVTGIVLGTPEFMSPEQIRGRPLDGRSDVYSLAVMAFELLTGKLPFVGRSAQEIMVARLRGQPLTLRDARPDLAFTAGVERVIRRGLAPEPQDRYRTAPEFAEALAGADDAPLPADEGWLGRLWGRVRNEGADRT